MPDRRLRGEEHPWRRILLAWLAVSVMLLAGTAGKIAVLQFPDPDDVLRLVQVRDLLAGQDWFDLRQHRLDPVNAVPMHWSRLVDIPLALVIGGLTPLLGSVLAEQIAVVVVPLLTLLVAMLFVGRMAWRLFDIETAGLACLAVGFLPIVIYQLQPLRIDHHGWQICAVIAAMWAINGRHGCKGGALAGLAMAAGITISLELLPVAALFGGVLALRWLRDPRQHPWLVFYLQSLAVSMAGLFLLTRGLTDLTPYCDAVTLPHISLFATVALGATLLSLAAPLRWPGLVLGLAASGAAGLAMFGYASPECLRTPFGALDPLVRDFWYVNVLEGRPVWDQPPLIYPLMLQILVGFAVALHLCSKAAGWQRQWWTDYLLVFAGTILLGLLVWRSMAFASILAALPLGYLLQRALAALRRLQQPHRRLALMAAMLVVLIPTAPVALAQHLSADSKGKGKAPLAQSSCDLFASAAKLSRLEQGTILAPLDIGPALIQRSPHAVLATGHHRAEAAMREVISGFLSPPPQTREMLRRHDVDYVVLCTDLIEPSLYLKRGGESSFAHQLILGTPPAWLEPVDLGTPETFRIWRVRPDGTSSPRR